MPEVRAVMWEEDGRWRAQLDRRTGAGVSSSSREGCLRSLRRAAGPEAILTVEVRPRLVGVAEAAELLGWDKRRIFTYLSRRSFPEPFAALASGRVWLRDDIEAFVQERQRRSGRSTRRH